MGRKRLLWQLYPSYLLITIIALVAVTWYASRALKQFYVEKTASDLEARAQLVEKQIVTALASEDWQSVNRLCRELGGKTSTRITVVLPSGRVVGDSEEDPEGMENHADRPEILAALAGALGTSSRYSRTLKQDMMYVALPLRERNEIIGVVRTSIPVTAVDRALGAIQVKIAIGGLIVAVLAAVLSLAVSRGISRPLERMKEGAQRFARGDLRPRLSLPDSEELAGLAEAMNQMASELDTRIRVATQQRSELEAVLSSMVEGVLAVDVEERVISMNQAAGQLLGVDPSDVQGRTIQEVVRNVDLLRFVARTLVSLWPVEGDIELYDGGERFLQAHGTILHDAQERGIGALVVLNDVTRMRRLENVRREFVDNVVHEIRTPVTSIKGFVETLLDGALHDREHAKRFLGIVARQTDRLNAIIEDLLSLSRIELETEKAEIKLEDDRIVKVLRPAVELCETKAAKKKIGIDLVCDEEIVARINPPLLEQAVVNLIDNAINYSPPRSEIQVEVNRKDNETMISVTDKGCGIPEEHLPRLFERFYRVDKARSRKLGGTGLGLAIVKHIIQAHGGHVTVDSTPNEGSTFQLHLPSLKSSVSPASKS
jgi:two-component system phosphate regulon sensor histidine kinase PhoR